MAINIQHFYTTEVDIHYYSEDGYALCRRDYGDMDSIAEQVCEVLVKHNFSHADVCSTETGEVLINLERS